METNKNILIGGTGRSGSNILKAILGQHKEVFALPFEPRYVLDPDGLVDFYNSYASWSPYNIDFKIQRLFRLLIRLSKRNLQDRLAIWLFRQLKINKRKLTPPQYAAWELKKHFPTYHTNVEWLKEQLSPFHFDNYWIGSPGFQLDNQSYFGPYIGKEHLAKILGTFIQKNIDGVLQKHQKSIYLDDSTFNILHALELQAFLPSAKLIHIYRDPRDVITSLSKQRWAPDDLQQTIQWYCQVMNRWQKVKKGLPDSYYLEVKFEDLIQHFSDTIQQISDFTQVDFSKMNHRLDLSRHNIGRWERDWDEETTKMLTNKTAAYLKLLGY